LLHPLSFFTADASAARCTLVLTRCAREWLRKLMPPIRV